MPNSRARNGILVTIEGISGSGKTALSNALRNEFESLGCEVLLLGGFEVHPYSSPITVFCRELVTTNRFVGLPWTSETHLLIAELLFDVERLVKPALDNGKIVIYDGYWDALLAFQSARIQLQQSSKGLSAIYYLKKVIEMIFPFETIPMPDCTIYIKCDVAKAKLRLEQRDLMPVTPEHLALQIEIARQYDSIFVGREILVIDNSDENNWQENVRRASDYIIHKTQIVRA